MNEEQPQDIQPESQPLEQPVETPPLPPPAGPKRLYRSSDQKMFLGVCGGLGEYFDIDPTLVRIIFVLSVLLAGASLAVYAVLALVMPSEASLEADPRTAAQNTINEASDEVRKGVDLAVTKVKEMTGRGTRDAGREP
ncbi:MAG: PspC domain-containing protein [Thermomicrobiales bacterium]